MKTTTLTIYKDKRGKHRWRIQAPNGKIVGASTQGFSTRYLCAQNAAMVGRVIKFSTLKILERAK